MILEHTDIEDVDRNARAYGWEVGRGKPLGTRFEMSEDNPFQDPYWREQVNEENDNPSSPRPITPA